jgi:LysR family transcriptional regulator, glycine cleavage system transcriptional activator
MKRRHVPLNALKAFEVVARCGLQTLAARELGVTHGAVSRQVRHLEEFLGTPLFDGPRNKPELTKVGSALASALTKAFDDVDFALGLALKDERTNLEVACLSSLAMRFLVPRLQHFVQLCPNIDVRLRTDDLWIERHRGQIDVSILALDDQTSSEKGDHELFVEQIGIVLAPALASVCPVATPNDVHNLTRLVTRTRKNAWSLWAAAMSVPEVEKLIAVSAEYDHYSFAIEAACAGLGVCAVPAHLVANDLRTGRLIAPFPFMPTGYRYVARQHREIDSPSQLFCTWLREECSRSVK